MVTDTETVTAAELVWLDLWGEPMEEELKSGF